MAAYTFNLGNETYIDNGNGYYFIEKEGKKHRISKATYEEAYDASNFFDQTCFESFEDLGAEDEIVRAESNMDNADEPAVINEFGCVECRDCTMTNCIHRDCMRRNPTEVGGLGECPRLKANKIKAPKATEKKEAKKVKTKKPHKSKDIKFESEEHDVTLTAKQVDFIKHLPDTEFWEGLDSQIWVDCLCDEIGGQFAAKPMTVGAMISTLCEKGLGSRATERRDGRKCTSFALTELGRKIVTELGF